MIELNISSDPFAYWLLMGCCILYVAKAILDIWGWHLKRKLNKIKASDK